MKRSKSNNWALVAGFVMIGLGWITLQSFTGTSTSSSDTIASELNCNPPNAYVTNRSSGSISFAWGPTGQGVTYTASYQHLSQPKVKGSVTTGNTSVTFSGLPAGRYEFKFRTNCGSIQSADIIIYDEVIH